MAWVLIPAARQLRAELDAIAPNRDRTSDGSIGDQAHASGVSGHNPDETGNAEYRDADRIDEVRAVDLDADLRRPGLAMEDVVQYLVRRCQSGAERRIAYMIYEGVIWGDANGFRPVAYTGANRHDKHLHVSWRPHADNDTSPYGLADLVEDNMPTVAEIWSHPLEDPLTGRMVAAGTMLRYADQRAVGTRQLVERLIAQVRAEVAALRTVVEQQGEVIRAGGGSVDTAAILAGVDARLAALPTAAQVADAVVAEIAS